MKQRTEQVQSTGSNKSKKALDHPMFTWSKL